MIFLINRSDVDPDSISVRARVTHSLVCGFSCAAAARISSRWLLTDERFAERERAQRFMYLSSFARKYEYEHRAASCKRLVSVVVVVVVGTLLLRARSRLLLRLLPLQRRQLWFRCVRDDESVDIRPRLQTVRRAQALPIVQPLERFVVFFVLPAVGRVIAFTISQCASQVKKSEYNNIASSRNGFEYPTIDLNCWLKYLQSWH